MPDVDDSVNAFREGAEAFCALIEQVEELDQVLVLERLSKLLPQLIHAATQLPVLEPDPDVDAPETDHAVWSERFAALNAKLGQCGAYWTTMEVLGGAEPDVVNLPLADDLADIWRDLRAGLLLLAAGGAIADVVWEWRFNFESHWGAHAIEALRVVHAARLG